MKKAILLTMFLGQHGVASPNSHRLPTVRWRTTR